MARRVVSVVLLGCVAVLLVPSAWAQDTSSKREFPLEYFNVEQILDVIVRNIASRYNLNEAQTQYTDELMKREVNKFLREHSDAVWPVIRDLVAGQQIGEPPQDPEELRKLGKSAKPLAKLAEEAIFKANEEWRTILSDDQIKMHDHDLAEMRKQFKGIHENIESWEKGTPLRNNIFPPPEVSPDEPRRPSKPPAGLPDAKPELPKDEHKGRVTLTADMFETYVEEFIKDNELDAGQVTSARSILKEFQDRAQAHIDANREALEKANAAMEAARNKRDHKALAEAEAQQREILEPLNELFKKMDERLQGLLTSTQRERNEEKAKAKAAEPTSKATPATPAKTQPSPKKGAKSSKKD
jgi:hypothetical protein